MADNSLGAKAGVPVVQAVISEWASYTPTGNFSTSTTYTGRWRRVGSVMQVRARLSFSGTPNTTDCTITLPSGYTIDSANLLAVGRDSLGIATLRDASAGFDYGTGLVVYNSSTSIAVLTAVTTGNGQVTSITQAVPVAIASGDQINVFFEVPIAEWAGSANVAYGAGLATSVKSGLLPSLSSALDNTIATQYGYKRYAIGTAYNAGITPTMTGTGYTVASGSLVPYQTQDGTWRLRINVRGTITSTSSVLLTLSGVTFSAVDQGMTFSGNGVASVTAVASGGTINVSNAVSNFTVVIVSGDVELASKPTWAY